MKINYNPTNRILAVLIAMVSTTLVFIGCVSEINEDFSPFSADPLHPFETVMDHGTYIKDNFTDYDECARCHGSDLRGVDNGIITLYGENDRSCFQCHNVQNHGFRMVDAASEHPQILRDNGYDRSSCYPCHTPPGVQLAVNFAGSCSNAACH